MKMTQMPPVHIAKLVANCGNSNVPYTMQWQNKYNHFLSKFWSNGQKTGVKMSLEDDDNRWGRKFSYVG